MLGDLDAVTAVSVGLVLRGGYNISITLHSFGVGNRSIFMASLEIGNRARMAYRYY